MPTCAVVSVRLVRDGRVHYGECSSHEQAAKIAGAFLQDRARESFIVLCMDAKARVTAVHECHIGTLNMSVVGPREVFQAAILANAAMVVVAHNHPSGDPTPSPEDIRITRKLVEVGDSLDIPVVDHIVVGDGVTVSLKSRGLL